MMPTAFLLLLMTLAIFILLLMGMALVTKRVISYCQKEQENTVLPNHFAVKASILLYITNKMEWRAIWV